MASLRAAGQVAADRDRRFLRVVEEVEDGGSLADALGQHPRYFDALYCGLLGAADSRESMAACLERLGG